MSESIDNVIEEFRQKRGLAKLHLTVGPDATPASIRNQLENMFAKDGLYYSIPENIRYEAQIQYLRDIISELAKLGKTNFAQFLSEQNTELGSIRSKINELTAIIPDVNIEYTLQYARKQGINI